MLRVKIILSNKYVFFILDEDIYAHVNNVMGLVSENLPKLEEKGFIKNRNIDNLINDIKNKNVFHIGSNSG